MEVLLLTILVGLALTAVRLRDLLASTAVLGAYSLMMAVLWCQMNALDVGFTEAAVGAGISTVLMLAAIGRIGRREGGSARGPLLRSPLMPMRKRRAHYRRTGARGHRRAAAGATIVCVLFGAVLLYGTRDMPRVGKADSRANMHPRVAQHYLRKSAGAHGEVGPPNIVTSVLGDYRGYDTMGETVVIFTAALSVLLLLRQSRGGGRREGDA
jgi:multicomponent Na+:H+ antiporter subunit B